LSDNDTTNKVSPASNNVPFKTKQNAHDNTNAFTKLLHPSYTYFRCMCVVSYKPCPYYKYGYFDSFGFAVFWPVMSCAIVSWPRGG